MRRAHSRLINDSSQYCLTIFLQSNHSPLGGVENGYRRDVTTPTTPSQQRKYTTTFCPSQVLLPAFSAPKKNKVSFFEVLSPHDSVVSFKFLHQE